MPTCLVNTHEAKRILEAALLSSTVPLTLGELRKLFDDAIGADTVRALLEEMRADWQDRPVELVALSTGWRFHTRAEYGTYLARLNPAKGSCAFRGVELASPPPGSSWPSGDPSAPWSRTST